MGNSIRNSNAAVVLKKGNGREFKAGGAWIYDNEIDRVDGSFNNGDVVELHDFDGFFLGYGFINTNSKIRVRMMSRKKEHPVNEELIEKRVRDAWEHRKAVMADYVLEYLVPEDAGKDYVPGADEYTRLSTRLIFGEADYLPGITIDKFSDVLVIESLALGTDLMKDVILDACK